MNHTRKANKDDEYYTRAYAIKPLLKYINNNSTIWCPFDKKDSNYVKVFKENGNKVIYSHIEDGKDFFTYEPTKYDYIMRLKMS